MNTINNVDMTQLLNRLRATAAVAEGRSPEGAATPRVDFSSLMKQALEQVRDIQSTSSELSTRLESGDKQISLEEVMIAREKSSIAFQATLQVRNKLISAYQEVMSMPI